MPASAALAVTTRSRAATARATSMVRRRVMGQLHSGNDGRWSAGIRSSRAGGLACVALDSCRITRRLFFVTMPRRSCGILSDSRNEWEEAVTAPVTTKRSPRTFVQRSGCSMSIKDNKMLVVGNSR